MARRYLGYGVTNSQGIATLDHLGDDVLSHSYTGIGAGKVDIVATSGNNLESEPYTITDCLFYQGESSKNEWFNASSRLTRTINDDGSYTLTNSSQSNGFYLANSIGTSKSDYVDVTDWDLGNCIEFDLISTDDTTNYIQLNDYVNSISSAKTFTSINASDGSHIKVVVANNGSVTYTVNDGTPITATNQTTKFAMGFRVNAGKTLTFKNFMIYPI